MCVVGMRIGYGYPGKPVYPPFMPARISDLFWIVKSTFDYSQASDDESHVNV